MNVNLERSGAGHRRASSPRSIARVQVLVLVALGILLALTAQPALAQNGTIVGKVLEDKSGKPLSFANVSILGTTMGAISREDGSFVLSNVPPGAYEVQASFMGYATTKVEVTVRELRTSETEIRLPDAVAAEVEEVVVTAERPLVDVGRGATVRTLTGDEIKDLTIEPTLDSVVEQQAGVTRDRDKIHIRGGRSGETLYIVDGVQMRDILSGESEGGSAVSARSVAEVNIITGGFDAKYGQAVSGIIDAKLKEGSDEYHGYIGYTTDRASDDWDVDLLDFQVSGPLPLLADILKPIGGEKSGKLTFFLNLAVDTKNGHLPAIDDVDGKLKSSYRDNLFGSSFRYSDFFYPRSANNWRAVFKTAWKASPANKFSVSVTKNMRFNQGFNENDIAEINRNTNNYPWSWKNRLDHYYTVSQDRNTFSFTWNNTINPTLLQQVKITRFFASRHQDVSGQLWSEYDTTPDIAIDPADDEPYFRDAGEPNNYRDRFIETWALDWDWTRLWQRHDIRWGIHSQYEDVQYLSLDALSVDPSVPGDLGDEFDLFHVYPNTGAFYLQDKLEFEGLIANIGVRYDYWFPGEQVDALYERQDRPTITEATRQEYMDDTNSFFGYRFKSRLAPRIQVSHPITESSHLFFNYGHFSQRPAYFYVYAKSSSQSSEEFPRIGNPNLNPEVSVQYELGAGHQFAEDRAIKVSLYNKDIYDYPTSTTIVLQERGTRRSDFFIYRNLDYARSRGIEIELRKRRTHRESWALSYTFSDAKGKSSDPNGLALVRESGGDARETSLDEEYMWWNRPHKFTAWINYSIREGDDDASLFGIPLPDDLRFNAYIMLQSGRAYTPEDVFGNELALRNSHNGPFDSTLNATLNKGFRVFDRRIELTIQGWNLLDHRNATEFDRVTGERFKPGVGSLNGPLENPDNLELSDLELAEIANVDLDIDRDDPRFDGLDTGTPEWDAIYLEILTEEAAAVAPGLRRSIQSTINQYADPSVLSPPRHFRIGLGMEW